MDTTSFLALTSAGNAVAFQRRAIWIGAEGEPLELTIARRAVAAQIELASVETPLAAVAIEGAGTPAFAVLAADRPGRFTAADALLLSRRWPLMPIVSVAASLVDGRRRSGPTVPGIEEVPWHDFPGRCRWWIAASEAGLPTSVGLPASSRREERLLGSIGGLAARPQRAVPWAIRPLEVAVAAARADDLEGLCDLLSLAGHRIVSRHRGRPRLDDPADRLVWDVRDIAPEELEWLRLLAANRPGMFIVLLEGFPRGDSVQAALRAGAAAVLGRPVSLEALAGTLLPPLPHG